jgi:hypothetical protein
VSITDHRHLVMKQKELGKSPYILAVQNNSFILWGSLMCRKVV